MATPTEWYTSLPGVGSVGAPEDRRPGAGGRDPRRDKFQNERRRLQNLMAKKQLELMEQKLRRARESNLQQRSDRLLAPVGEQYERMNAPRRPRKVPGTDYGATAKAFFDMMGGHRKPGDVQAMAKWLKFIGPGRAHAGMMQSGKLLGGQGGGGVMLGPEEAETPIGMSGSPGAMPPPPGTRVGPGGVPLSREKGGTIPKTGPYELHKGEIVVSADQVDRPLLAALKADKLSKMHSGQMDGKGTGPGPPTAKSMVKDEFMGGTLHSYRDGTLRDDPRFLGHIRDLLGEYMGGGNELEPEKEFGDDPGRTPEQAAAMEEWMTSGRGGFSEADSVPDPEGSQFGGLGELARLLGSKVNVSGPSPANWFNLGPEDEAAPGPGELAETLGGAEVEPLPMGRDTSMAPMVGPQADLERAGGMINERTIQRAAGGDRGLGAAGPLTMVSSGPADPDSWTEQMKDPELRKADMERTMAALNTQKADRLQNYLMQNAGEMDPQTFKSIQDQANQLKAINKSERDRQDLKDENAKDRIVEMEKAYSDYQGQLARAQATGQASQNVGLRQAEGQLRGKLERYELKFLEGVEDGWGHDVLGAYVDAMFDIKAQLEGVEPSDPGYQEERDAYINYQMSVVGER